MNYLAIQKTIHKAKKILISTHVNPDPDALASELALALYLKAKGKKVFVINEEAVPHRFTFLPADKLLRPLKNLKRIDYDAAIILDCGELDRIGKVRTLLRPGKPVINIDHHITNDMFGTHNLVVSSASSSSEVLYDFLKRGGCRFSRDMAMLLYLGIMTDTGSFRYENTSAHTHAIVSDLLKFKFSVPTLYKKLYESVPLKDLKAFIQVVAKFQSLFGTKVACIELSKKILSKFSQDFDLRDKIFGFLRTSKSVEVIIIFTEDKAGITRVNLRSQSRVDVARLAHHFKGGGHSRASGCLIRASMKKAKRQILKELKKVL